MAVLQGCNTEILRSHQCLVHRCHFQFYSPQHVLGCLVLVLQALNTGSQFDFLAYFQGIFPGVGLVSAQITR